MRREKNKIKKEPEIGFSNELEQKRGFAFFFFPNFYANTDFLLIFLSLRISGNISIYLL